MDKTLKERLRKFQAVIDDPGASEGEINNATAMMNKLLLKHNLDKGAIDLSYHDVDKGGVPTDSSKNEGPWERRLAQTLAKYNLCMSYLDENGKSAHSGTIQVLGTEDNVELVLEQFSILRTKFRAMAKVRVKEAKAEAYGKFNPNKWKRDYLKGSVIGLADRLESQKSDLGTDSGEYGLMVVKHNAIVQDYVDRNLNLTSKSGRKQDNNGAYRQGQTDGNRTNFQRALN